ncbi:MAG: hypothetical protein H7330_17350 [Hymenobacteraceae bacterium]|nr:hypothetical protein [Hymenobacteraceae bacterium]
MIQLRPATLEATALQYLAKVQTKIDQQPAANRATFARNRWEDKLGPNGAREAFTTIKDHLRALCVDTEGCNYCEGNEGRDIEHIYPKSFFPERAFQWDNYLLACKTCNTDFKKDKFAVFSPRGSAQIVDLQQGLAAPTDDAAFIDPRQDNPLDFLWLNLRLALPIFIVHPNLAVGSRAAIKAQKTLDILQLNARRRLAEERHAAYGEYLHYLAIYGNVIGAATMPDLVRVEPYPRTVNVDAPFEQEKLRIATSIWQKVLKHRHPTVWHELKRQRLVVRDADHLFRVAPAFGVIPAAEDWLRMPSD